MGRGRSEPTHRLVDMTIHPEDPADDRPLLASEEDEGDHLLGVPLEEEERWEIPLDDGEEIKVREVYRHDGRRTDFALIYRTRGQSGIWHEVARVDTAHGSVHLHKFTRRGEKWRMLKKIGVDDDVEVGYDEAVTLLCQEWQSLKEEWGQ